MKEKLTLRNLILAVVATIGLVLFFVSFGASASLKGFAEDSYGVVKFSTVVWSSSAYEMISGSVHMGGVIPEAYRVASVPGIIGALLFILVSGGLIAVVFLVKNEKVRKILMFVCGGLYLAAAILMFFVGEVAWKNFATMMGITVEAAKSANPGLKASSPYGIVSGIFGIIMAGGVIASNFIPDKKLVK